ncbi:MAG: tyrosine-type recombinase/integrase [Glaciecola sp.]|jgi:integrase
MFKLATRKDSNSLYFNGTYLGFRCREYTGLKDNRENKRLMNLKLKAINEAIQRGVFRYAQFFPDSKNASDISIAEKQVARVPVNNQLQYLPQGLRQITPTLHEFADLWMDENKISWRKSHRASIEGILAKHVMPVFGAMPLETIKREHILQFRTQLSELKGKNGNGLLSNSRINKVMSTLRQVLNEAALRYDFATPYQNIKQLKNKPKDIHPFSLSEVSKILDNVRADYKNYYTVRFFTGMRTGEIDGLKWRYVDFERRLILVRETIVNGIQEDETKTLSSQREIEMSDVVFNALKSQFLATNDVSEYVFCTTTGSPLAHNNVTKRVWKPLLAKLNLEYRRPYQSRHSIATLWLAAGESPEWIAKQLGHANTMMLFTVYSRYVPNLTRQDGSAFESLLIEQL